MIIRRLKNDEVFLLKEFLYQAIFIPAGMTAPERSIIELPELKVYYEEFGSGRADHCLIAEEDGTVVGAVWTRIMHDYGHVDEATPSLAISLLPSYRGKGIGTELLAKMLDLLKEQGYEKVSLSVQKANTAVRLYERAGFEIIEDRDEEYLMICPLTAEKNKSES